MIGAKYDTMGPELMKKMAGLVKRGRFLYCAKGSHLCMYDDQQAYFEGLIRFIRDGDGEPLLANDVGHWARLSQTGRAPGGVAGGNGLRAEGFRADKWPVGDLYRDRFTAPPLDVRVRIHLERPPSMSLLALTNAPRRDARGSRNAIPPQTHPLPQRSSIPRGSACCARATITAAPIRASAGRTFR